MSQTAPPNVFLVLAMYNGGRFLAEQLQSLQAQTWTQWRLLVRDDGSSDNTRQVAEQFAAIDPRIEILSDGLGRLGPTGNFGALLEQATARGADYVFFVDQDDVWKPGKIQRQLECMACLQSQTPPGTPLLVHSDLSVVDADLTLVHPSFMAYQGIRHEPAQPLPTLLVQNFVTGCAMLINRPLAELALPVPKVPVHDWWIAACAAAAGRIGFLPEATVLYRQHGGNSVGAKSHLASLNPWRFVKRRLNRRRGERTGPFSLGIAQAEQLRERLRSRGMSPQSPPLKLLDNYCRWCHERSSRWTRLRQFASLGVRRQSPIKHFALYLYLLKNQPV
jgi:glycosyltransferase involved in cell wall biosynthesis